MEFAAVIARAWGGEPMHRLAVDRAPGVVFLANPERLVAIQAGETSPAGFPEEDVFEFDEGVFAALAEQWARQRATDPATWQRLKPYELRSSRG